MDFQEELKNTDFDDLFDRLVAYAFKKLGPINIRVLDGKEPCDIVAELFEKVLTGVRNSQTADCSLNEFLFGCLRSDIDAFFNRKKTISATIHDETAALCPPNETAKQSEVSKEHYILQLREVGADEEEISVFKIWSEGVTKPAQVGIELEVPAKTIYGIQRRLFKHQEDIRKKSKAFA